MLDVAFEPGSHVIDPGLNSFGPLGFGTQNSKRRRLRLPNFHLLS